MHIETRIARDFELVIALLKLLCLRIEPTLHERSQNHANRFAVFLLETHNGDHTVGWIPQAIIRCPVAKYACSINVRFRREDNRRNMAVIGAKRIPIHVQKFEPVDLTDRHICDRHGRNQNNCRGGKKLECARFQDKHVCHDQAW